MNFKICLNINNQSVIVFCPRAGLSLQIQHSPLYPLLSLPFRIFIQSIYHNVVYHLTPSSALNFLPFTSPSRTSFSRQYFLSQGPSQFLFLFISSNIILPSPNLSSTIAFVIFVHFTRSILIYIHISNASSSYCSFRHSVKVSAPYNATLHTKHFNSLFLYQGPAENASFLVKNFFCHCTICLLMIRVGFFWC